MKQVDILINMTKKTLDRILTKSEQKLLAKLNTPTKIQTWLESIPFNTETKGETLYSPRQVIKYRKAHCLEGALFAGLALAYHGHHPFLLDLKVDNTDHDSDHVVALFNVDGHWGAISKTRHAVLRYRDPIYKSIRELVMSYFHEYFIKSGHKTLRSYSTKPFDLSKLDNDWITSEEHLYPISTMLDRAPHTKILTPKMVRGLRKATKIEIKTGEIVE
jgi:hypothetical protein